MAQSFTIDDERLDYLDWDVTDAGEGMEDIRNTNDILEKFCLFCCFTSPVNSYGHCGTVSSPNHTFSWAGLNKLTSNSCTYFRL